MKICLESISSITNLIELREIRTEVTVIQKRECDQTSRRLLYLKYSKIFEETRQENTAIKMGARAHTLLHTNANKHFVTGKLCFPFVILFDGTKANFQTKR